MKIIVPSDAARVQQGISIAITVTYADLAGLTSGQTATLPLFSVIPGHLVELVGLHLKTPFTKSDGGTVLLSTIGDGDSVNRYLLEYDIMDSGTPYSVGTGIPFVYLANDTVDLALDAGDDGGGPPTPYDVTAVTAGELRLWFKVIELTRAPV